MGEDIKKTKQQLINELENLRRKVAGDKKSFISAQLSPVRNRHGKITAVMGITRDITRQKKAEEALKVHRGHLEELVEERTLSLQKINRKLQEEIAERKSAESELLQARKEWENIFQAIGHLTMILDSHHTILSANRASEKSVNMVGKKLIGKKCFEIFHGMKQHPEKCPLQKLRTTGESDTIEMEMETLDGTFLVSCTPVFGNTGRLEKMIHIATDITEQKQAQNERDRILNLSNDLICIVGMDGYFRYLNPAWEKTLGYTIEQFMMKPFLDFIYPDDQGTSAAAVGKLAQSPESTDFENRYIHMDGSVRTISWRATPVVSEGLIYCVGRDITEIRHNIDALRTAKDFLENLIETANVIILTLDEKANITTFNRFAEKLTGYKKEEVFGKNWFKLFIPKRERNEIPQIFKDVLHKMSESSSHENAIVCKDAKEKIIDWKNTVVKDSDGHVSGVLSIGIDITERRQAAEALEESEKKYRLLVENATEAIAAIDRNGTFLVLNNTAAIILGGKPEDLIGKTLWDLLPESVAEERMVTALKVMKSGRGVIHIIEIPVRGETRWYRQNTQPIRDSSGTINAILSISSDITKSKEAEEELRKYRNDLECLIKERTAELEKKNTELERMNRLFVGREFRIKELKNRIHELEKTT